MRRRTLLLALAIALLAANVVLAAAEAPEGQEYTVQPGDWLSKIAADFLGDIFAYSAIVEATSAKAAEDTSFDAIDDPDVIEIGQKLWIPALAPEAGPLTPTALMNVSYAGIYDEAAPLADGKYEGQPFVEGGASRPTVTLVNQAFGDLNGDGTSDAAVALVENSGGSGVFWYLAAVIDQGGQRVNVATRFLGDRWQVREISISDGEILLDTVTHGPDDPMCCPSLEMIFAYSLRGDQLLEIAAGDLTAEDLQNETYVGIYGEPVQLSAGKYEGEPFVEGGASRPTVTLVNQAFGDLNGDGVTDAIALLVENSGGSGVFWYLAALLKQDGQLVNVSTRLLGDRWQMRSVSVTASGIVLDAVTHGPDDPMCCPSVEMVFTYALEGDRVLETSPAAAGIYKGVGPAATCCGRDITLFLNADHSASRKTDYLYGEPPVVETGSWQYGQGGAVALALTAQAGAFYEATDWITFEFSDDILTALEFETSMYGSAGPPDLTRFQALALGTRKPAYDEAAATEMIETAEFLGIYKGFLPAATCCGQDITLSLGQITEGTTWDNLAQLSTDYLNGEPPIVEMGAWEVNDAGGVTITLKGREDRTYDQPKVIDFELAAGTLVTAEGEDAYGSVGLRLFYLRGMIAATF